MRIARKDEENNSTNLRKREIVKDYVTREEEVTKVFNIKSIYSILNADFCF